MKRRNFLLILILASNITAYSNEGLLITSFENEFTNHLYKKDTSANQKNIKGTFLYDLTFLKKYHQDLVLLSDGDAKLIVLPKYQGRVMTSTAEGDKGLSFGWINHDLISSQQHTPHFSAFGGEDRFWLGPEGGQFSIYFKPNTSFVFDNWYVPPSLDVESFDLIQKTKTEVQFKKNIHLSNYSGTNFDVQVNRKIKLLNKDSVTHFIGGFIGSSIKVIGFESENTVTNIGKSTWTKESGLLSIWILNMLQANDQTTVFVPYQKGEPTKMGKIVTDDYFGKLNDTRLKVKDGYLLFKADAKQRSKIGISPKRSLAIAASFDAKNNVLTILQFTMPQGQPDYVNSLWEKQLNPYNGDAMNAYSDGPINGKQMGNFYEIESSSPAMSLSPGASQKHIQRTIHLKGDIKELDAITHKLFGISIDKFNLK